mmetsp:Transcript_22734/g.28658  ORF Transcript_22734/g.28658 Transcript_22734/m.28658 type:complete len:84 (+) Transcript_22734:1528-1779(+)
MIVSRHPKQQSAMQRRIPSSVSRAFSSMVLTVWMIATSKEPRQMDPNEFVMARAWLERTASEQQESASKGAHHQVPTVPATVT